ncbi:MAG: hypothetical protein JWO89_3820 [Verrucomicrobiaceae bacterium]|nr:hypothetical protein [Verrucomicrobiaceae bacterium]
MGSSPLSRSPVNLFTSGVACLKNSKPARFLRVLFVLPLAFLGVGAGAQTADLTSLRAKLELGLAQGSLPALRQYIGELAALEKQAVAGRDYETASLVRTERLRATAEAAAQEKLALLLETRQQTEEGKGASAKIVLKISDAKLDGVILDPSTNVLTGWSKPGASATWKLPDLPPGGYEVVLRYASGPLEGGNVLVQEAFYTLSGSIGTTLKGFEEQNIGTLKIRDGSGPFKIIAKTVLKNNLMQLQGVELLPANR